MKKIYITLILAIFGISGAFSKAFWTINYDMGVPMGAFSDYISKSSFRGFSINGNKYINDNITLGGTYSWSAYREHLPRNTYELDDGALTSEIWKKMYINTFLFNARYMFKPEASLQPYVGLGMGAYHVEQNTQAGRYISIPKNWKFGLAPEVGLFVPIGVSDWGLNVKATYNAIFYNVEDINTLTNLQFSVGVGIYSW